MNKNVIIPERQTSGSSGYDIRAFIPEEIELQPGARMAIPTGLICEIPNGYMLSVRPRSGLALKHGLTHVNTPGTIDSDYRGEIKILMINLGDKPYTIQPHERIGQLILEKSYSIEWEENENLNNTERGEQGFGSTGTHS